MLSPITKMVMTSLKKTWDNLSGAWDASLNWWWRTVQSEKRTELKALEDNLAADRSLPLLNLTSLESDSDRMMDPFWPMDWEEWNNQDNSE